eukprot:g6247.t1
MKCSMLAAVLVLFMLSSRISECRQSRVLNDAFSDNFSYLTNTDSDNVVSTSSSVKAVDGSASVRVKATSQSVTDVKNSVTVATADAIAVLQEGDGDAAALAHAVAKSTAKAVAKAFTAVLVEIKSDGEKNKACGSAFASAEAAATAYAVAITKAIAAAATQAGVAVANADSTAIASATAKAFAKAETIACVDGKGEAKAHQVSFAASIAKPYATAFSTAFASVSAEGANARVHSDAESGVEEDTIAGSKNDAHMKGNGYVKSRGKSGATVTEHPSCHSTPFEACCYRNTNSDHCDCDRIPRYFYGFKFEDEPSCSATRISNRDDFIEIYRNDAKYSRFAEPTYPRGFKCVC